MGIRAFLTADPTLPELANTVLESICEWASRLSAARHEPYVDCVDSCFQEFISKCSLAVRQEAANLTISMQPFGGAHRYADPILSIMQRLVPYRNGTLAVVDALSLGGGMVESVGDKVSTFVIDDCLQACCFSRKFSHLSLAEMISAVHDTIRQHCSISGSITDEEMTACRLGLSRGARDDDYMQTVKASALFFPIASLHCCRRRYENMKVLCALAALTGDGRIGEEDSEVNCQTIGLAYYFFLWNFNVVTLFHNPHPCRNCG
jgi:hypothetical protein